MNEVATALKSMMDAGVPNDVIVEAIAKMVDAIPRAESEDERRRRISRETSQRYRSKQPRDAVASPRVTPRHQEPVTRRDTTASPVTLQRHQTSPLARVEDKLLTTVISGNPSSSSERESSLPNDWPEGDPGHLAKTLAMLAGPGLGEMTKHPGLTTSAGEIVRWKQAGCSWALDVVPTVQGRTLKVRPRPITGWHVLTPDVLGQREARLKPAEVIHLEPARRSAWQEQEDGIRAATARLKEKYADAH